MIVIVIVCHAASIDRFFGLQRRRETDAFTDYGNGHGDFDMRSISVILCVFVLCGAGLSAAAAPPWSERGVFVFGWLVLDFQRGIEAQGVGPRAGLANCSTDTLYCAAGDIVRVVLPKDCSDIKSGRWSQAGIETEVLGKFDDPQAVAHPLHAYGTGTLYLLGSSARPDVVYEYDPGIGVRGLYYSYAGEDIVAAARAAGWDALRKKENRGLLYSSLITLDPFGACIGNRTPDITAMRHFPQDQN
jgi:hypothetical protein